MSFEEADMSIPFTQYVLPNGKRKSLEITRPAEIMRKAYAILAAGYHFECEQLRDGIWSYTIGDNKGDYAQELSHHGPTETVAIDTMVTEFFETLGSPKEGA